MIRKILFCQGFSLQQPGGGATILKKLITHSIENKFSAEVCFDEREVPNEFLSKALEKGEVPIKTRNRNAFNQRFNFLIPILIVLGFDRFTTKKFTQYLNTINPNVIHITAHGLTFPLFFKLAKKWGKAKVVISVHDLWQTTLYTPVPEWLVKRTFTQCLRAADVCYVISEEMGEYLKLEYRLKQYLVIHDGYEENVNSNDTVTTTKKRNHLLYVGLMTDHQLQLTQELLTVMGSMDAEFVLGICSTRELKPKKDYQNITIHNYGWVNEQKLKELSKTYAFGLLPTSFDDAMQLFYRTSLMTKVPFYFHASLPVFCIGDASYAAIRLIKKEKAGVCCTKNETAAFESSLHEILSMTDDKYLDLVSNCLRSVQTTFNSKSISRRFYASLN